MLCSVKFAGTERRGMSESQETGSPPERLPPEPESDSARPPAHPIERAFPGTTEMLQRAQAGGLDAPGARPRSLLDRLPWEKTLIWGLIFFLLYLLSSLRILGTPSRAP